MGFFDLFQNRTKVSSIINETTDYDSKNVGSIEIPDRLTEQNAFTLANTVSEIYFAVDFFADRASKLRFFIADKSGNEVTKTELNRFVTDINPLFSFSDIVYQYIFSYLSDGNAFTYLGVPSMYEGKINPNTISRIDILQPNSVYLNEYTNISPLNISSLNEIIKQAKYLYDTGLYQNLDTNRLKINNIDATRRSCSFILSKSPLFKAVRSINNLLATYSARYNVYVNNGAAGYLVKKQTASSNVLQEAVNPQTRQDILDEINSRNGLTGKRNLWGISSIPIEFINTLSDIQRLMPFDETLENSIKIASIYGIKSELVPRKDQSTFSNQDTAEKTVWENAIMSIVETFCQNYTKNTGLDKLGYFVKPDYSTVSALQSNEKTIEEINKIKIENLEKIKSISPDKQPEVDKEIDKILKGYNVN